MVTSQLYETTWLFKENEITCFIFGSGNQCLFRGAINGLENHNLWDK